MGAASSIAREHHQRHRPALRGKDLESFEYSSESGQDTDLLEDSPRSNGMPPSPFSETDTEANKEANSEESSSLQPLPDTTSLAVTSQPPKLCYRLRAQVIIRRNMQILHNKVVGQRLVCEAGMPIE